MQQMLEKMAKKLNDYDEASLMQMWQHFASQVHDFEPTRRWEEAALALCLIQAVHWKNQLFNYRLALSARPADKADMPPLPDFFRPAKQSGPQRGDAPAGAAAHTCGNPPRQKATILAFPGKFPSPASSAPAAPVGEDRADDAGGPPYSGD